MSIADMTDERLRAEYADSNMVFQPLVAEILRLRAAAATAAGELGRLREYEGRAFALEETMKKQVLESMALAGQVAALRNGLAAVEKYVPRHDLGGNSVWPHSLRQHVVALLDDTAMAAAEHAASIRAKARHELLDDLQGRGGFDAWWEDIGPDNRHEIDDRETEDDDEDLAARDGGGP